MKIRMITDGACRGNPGIGAWVAILVAGDRRRVVYNVHQHTTANQMELHALLGGLEALKAPCEIEWLTDSVLSIGWIYGWNSADKQPDPNKLFRAKNSDIKVLVSAIKEVIRRDGHTIIPIKVDAHKGENLVADDYARRAITEYDQVAEIRRLEGLAAA